MKEIQQIKMRKDIEVLTDKYKISISGLARELELPERTLREFIFAPQRNLNDENFVRTKDGLEKIKQEIKIAEEYKGFDEGEKK
tara:strand:- start:270 stop:521 length:252 start_codon:yes stop_codon:yes gene_type:complete